MKKARVNQKLFVWKILLHNNKQVIQAVAHIQLRIGLFPSKDSTNFHVKIAEK